MRINVSTQTHVAISAAGEPFVMPRSTNVLEWDPQGAMIGTDSWFADPLLNAPGRLRLQALLGTFPAEWNGVPAAAAYSNVAVLEIVLPQNERDLEIWKQMLVLAGGKWTPGYVATLARDFARNVVVEHPESAYAGWFAASAPWQPSRESAALLRGWLEEAPQDEHTEWREYRLALLEEFAAREWTRSTRGEVRQFIDDARRRLTKLQRSNRRTIRRAATERLASVADAERSLNERER